MQRTKRKSLLIILVTVWTLIAIYGWQQIYGQDDKSLTKVVIGYQAGDEIEIAKLHGSFVKKMKAKGYAVSFREFQNGSAMMQALASGKIDYGRVGDTPPVSALASGTKLTFVGAGGTRSLGSGIVVTKKSWIKKASDLAGKKIAYTRGTSSQYMVLKTLKKLGLTTDDVNLVNMDTNSAALAFAKGKVDAWATWDPYVSKAELKQQAKLVVSGSDVGVQNRNFLVSPTSFASKHQELNSLVVKYLGEDMQWANSHTTVLTKKLAAALDLDRKVVQRMLERRTFALQKMSQRAIKEEQIISNLFYAQKVIKKKVQISSYVEK
ncbi:nitrate/sulfonate/bicarbonate ABC transporter substrate-binding component [Ligilactobacillus salitolerans]|uniref:Putative aliphatic sulfonates-binding protein n=1 Tax=Ligilactobacillus salitolerans TaxID=1808352 RepID=A0A401ISB9_9LACO|nr:nitrate/sulfonate/bicarbonate ABC transporter substrate-binding component [Ligilactobacillus salitolerans]